MFASVAEIDWPSWKVTDTATLLFVVRGGEVLLIRKKRGLGAGKINAPGGRLEAGESPRECALRETQEEVGVIPTGVRERGELRFQFVDGYALHCHVFSADGCTGAAIETDEATPQWVSLAAIPYSEMWADDRLWLPMMLSGRTPFSGRFIFDGDTMVDHVIEARDPAAPLFAKLDELGIAHATAEHPPVFTVEEAKRHRVRHDGVHVKNLFLRNKKGAMFLVTVREDRPVDLKHLAATIAAGHVSFASYDRLREFLGVEPGSVTPFAAIADAGGQVRVVLERAVAEAATVFCHPLTNDRTTAVSGPGLVRLLEAVGHSPQVIDLA
jgi:8-oxo-dGTP diphosphatase